MRNEKYEKLELSSGELFFDLYYNESFCRYIKNLWEDEAEYKVMMSNRMLNLNNIFMEEWHAQDNKQFLTDGIMSDTAFLLDANSIAGRYAYRKRFPRILLCDDVMVYNHEIIKFLDKFYKLVSKQLAEYKVEVSERELMSDQSKAIIVYTFARSKNEELLVDTNKYRLCSSQILPINRLREMSLRISDYLLDHGAVNTSYDISVKLPWYYIRELISTRDGDLVESFKYKERCCNVFFRERSPYFLETMRLYYPDGDPKQGGVLTSHTFFRDISAEDFKTLCNNVAYYMERDFKNSQIAKYLRREDIELVGPKVQLLSFLYSLLSLVDFCRQNLSADRGELYRILVSGDFNKTISNFDKGDIFRYEILTLFKSICFGGFRDRLLWYYLNESVMNSHAEQKENADIQYDAKFQMINVPFKNNLKKEYTEVEDILYGVGMNGEYDAYQYIYSKPYFDVNKPSFNLISFQRFIRLMERKGSSRDIIIAILLGMVDRGLFSFDIKIVESSELKIVRTMLKTGDLAVYLLPERFSIFIPALVEVEKHYKQIGRNVHLVISAFIEFIQDYCYEQAGNDDMRDKYLLNELKEKNLLLLYLYSCGQKFEDWDIDFRNMQKYYMSYLGKENGVFSLKEEMVRKNYYLNCAKKFCSKYSIRDQNSLSRKMRNE